MLHTKVSGAWVQNKSTLRRYLNRCVCFHVVKRSFSSFSFVFAKLFARLLSDLHYLFIISWMILGQKISIHNHSLFPLSLISFPDGSSFELLWFWPKTRWLGYCLSLCVTDHYQCFWAFLWFIVIIIYWAI